MAEPQPLGRRQSRQGVYDLQTLIARQDAHEDRDEDRFGVLNNKVDQLDDRLTEVDRKVGLIGEDVSFIKGQIEGLPPPAVAPPPPAPISPGDWHVGPRAWAALSALAMAALAVMGWLAVQVYDLQPARMKVPLPLAVEIAQPPPSR